MKINLKNKKNLFLLFGILAMIIFSSIFISSLCCEKLDNGGAWCQVADDENACDSNYNVFYTETCDAISVPECHGVCVNENSGECSENVAQLKCSDELNGVWYEDDIEDISVCQDVCCVLGDEVAFVTPTECKNLFTEYGVQGEIREDITDRNECSALGQSFKEGACVIETDLEKTCKRTTEAGCNLDFVENLTENLQYGFTQNEIYLHFEEGYLCTAKKENSDGEVVQLSDCAKSKNTICDDNKVYFTDTCGNKANVYDASKYDGTGSVDYWTYIKNPSNSDEVCQINGPSSTCGNCDVVSSGTVCQAENEAQGTGNAQFGNLVCGDLSCRYNGKTYKHSESWCGGTEGTLVPIEYNFNTSEISESSRSELENQDEYNVPGSRYYKMTCSFGEVLVEECADYRNQVCVQGDNDLGNSQASCIFNPWRTCYEIETKSSCEDSTSLCKWVAGYRWDLEIVNEKNNGLRDEKQGSCVPLIAPGFDFWKSDTQGSAICSSATVQEYALYETTWWVDRDDFAGWGDKTQSNRCINGCYAIPKYGSNFDSTKSDITCDDGEDCGSGEFCFSGYCVQQELYDFYDESGYHLDENVDNYFLSDRKGQYCHKDGKPDEWLTGPVTGSAYDCAAGAGNEAKQERKERDFPIFLTHQIWLSSITERARSLGDCGYKTNINGDYSAPETEIVTAIFEKLKQSGEVRSTITAEQIIYKAGVWVGDETETYNEGLYDVTEYSCSEQGGVCLTEFNTLGNENCVGEIIESEDGNLCPGSKICCIVEDLG